MTDPEQEPQRHTGYLIRRAQQAHVATWTRMVSTEISSVQYSVLVILDQRGEASQRDLCDAVDLDRSTIADLVRRMEGRGLIERRRDPDDARRNTVSLTSLGGAERERLRPLVAAADAELTAALSPAELVALREGLRRLLAR
ncbi:MarR family winged helix-turn-helix transcriptional regulator [Demequina lignilytica]|uniref:MarR family winged helix-turn-helix transcriptional regulator n=1 Tax=Demequina lignilytica TaxID=3051663 RepID=A0AB35MIG0_9MICO|nr:MarR family winged helix-turn-helix transcriptional regulator [Demequina sp. SYSU T0a273]MDN4483495.1 MarR family winged helix-turn-helix transcriptional regulator [Demequina sp. SYSU T0a273]